MANLYTCSWGNRHRAWESCDDHEGGHCEITETEVNRVMRGKSYQSIGETHITFPGSADLFDSFRFHGQKTFCPLGVERLIQVGEIHDAVGGLVATVDTIKHEGVQTIAVFTGRGGYWGRAYDPAQDIVEQIALVAIIALKGVEGETRS